MREDAAILLRALAWFARAVAASEPLFREFKTGDLGTELPATILNAGPVQAARQALTAATASAGTAATALETAADTGSESDTLAALLQLADALGRFFQAVGPLESALAAAITPAAIPNAAQRAEASALAAGFKAKLADHIIVSGITDELPALAFYLKLLGLIEWKRHRPAAGQQLALTYVEKGLRLHRIKDLISDPLAHFEAVYGWGAATFDPQDLFDLFAGFFEFEDGVISTRIGADAALRFGDFELVRDSTVSPPGLALTYSPRFTASAGLREDVTDQWGVNVAGSLNASGRLTGTVRPPFTVSLRPPAGQIGGEAKLFFDRNESARPFAIVSGGPISLTANNTSIGVGLAASWQSSTNSAAIEPKLFADMRALTLRIGTADGDSFINTIIGGSAIEGQFDLGMRWQPSTGLRIEASGGIEIAIPVHRHVGPIEIATVYLALRILPDGTLSLETSAGINGALGPLAASVERLGLVSNLRFAAGAAARMGPLEFALAFKPPNGIGLAVDAGPVRGGGYLFIDAERGEYAGVLELTFAEFLSLKAVGIITTRMPDGSPGFSLLIIITAEFGAGLQLGFGFTLVGVGGILGLNRIVNADALVSSVRTGAITRIMFPQNVVQNAPRIISDLRAIFPPRDGVFLIGPMAKLGWGTPTLVSISLGIIIEIPGNVTMLGVLRVALPTETAPVLQLQVSFVGRIEFDRKRIYFFASLFDSRVLFITLDGDMGLLAAFGEDANFVLSVGGFHPRFTPPPLPFPVPTRIVASILNESWGRIRAECYFAVTSNTAQFGSRTEIFFGFSALSVESSMSFDALFQFSPFRFSIAMSSRFSVKVFGVGVWGLSIELLLEGPAPWHAKGRASISLLFFDIPVHFDETWGERRGETLPPVSVMPLLATEFGKKENWRAFLPQGRAELVSLRAFAPEEDALVLHPAGTLRVLQKLAPLGIGISKLGNRLSDDGNKFSIAAAPGAFSKAADAQERFAAAEFNDLSEADRLAAPAFENQNGGLDLAPQGRSTFAATAIRRTNRYELTTIDTQGEKPRITLKFRVIDSLFAGRFHKGTAPALSALSAQTKVQKNPFTDKVSAKGESFAVASTDTNTVFGGGAFASEAAAREFINTAVVNNPSLANQIHVVNASELAA